MEKNKILVVNAGSSSIKLATFNIEHKPSKIAETQISVNAGDFNQALAQAINWLGEATDESVGLIVHRIVHGGPKYFQPVAIDQRVLSDLRSLILLDTSHMQLAVDLVANEFNQHPEVPQLACFDTAFHHDLPMVARALALPRRYLDLGVRRYGFHGLSCAGVLRQLAENGDQAESSRIIVAHLGSGSSLSAINHGQSVDTTMSLTPLSGVPMSTRLGDIDPALPAYLEKVSNIGSNEFMEMASHDSGLLGLSETSGDMKQLLEIESSDHRAAEAIDHYCYQIKKQIGAYAAVLGGVDNLVFTGGIGEQAPKIRARICDGLDFLGVGLDEQANQQNASIISNENSDLKVRVMPSDEALEMAYAAKTYLNQEVVT